MAGTAVLEQAQQLIDENNRTQNEPQNTSTKGMAEAEALLKTLDGYLKKVMQVGRKLFKQDEPARRQYEQTAVLALMHAGERPKAREGEEEGI